MPDPFWLKALLKAVFLPPTGPLLLALVGLGLLKRNPRTGRALAFAGVSSLLLLSIPAFAVLLLRCLDTYPPFEADRAKSAQAIVILGGGIRRNATEYGGDTLGQLTLERVRYGARVARETGLPVLVSGGAVDGEPTEARLMRDSLEREFGVRVQWSEALSRNTHENAVRSAEILRAAGVRSVILVAHGFDMMRAGAEFAAEGIEIIAAPTGFAPRYPESWRDFVPSIGGMRASYYALYEILGNLVRRIAAG
jgi:uncharacterized SAM-binding protein YcdF (DUF218 family)